MVSEIHTDARRRRGAMRAQLLVLSTRGEATMARVLGAVSQHVPRNTPCPVLVVPDGSESL